MTATITVEQVLDGTVARSATAQPQQVGPGRWRGPACCTGLRLHGDQVHGDVHSHIAAGEGGGPSYLEAMRPPRLHETDGHRSSPALGQYYFTPVLRANRARLGKVEAPGDRNRSRVMVWIGGR